MRKSDSRARSLGLFAGRLASGYLAFGGFHGNVIPVADLREEEPDNSAVAEVLADVRKKDCVPWNEASEQLWNTWLEHLHRRGVTALRILPRRNTDGDVLDLCGKINQRLLNLMERFFAAAQPYGIRFLLVLMPEPDQSGYLRKEFLKKWVGPAYTKSEIAKMSAAQRRFVGQQRAVSLADYFTDADVWACQRLYLDGLCEWIKKRPEIFALEIVNQQGWDNNRFHWDVEEAMVAWGIRVAEYAHKRAPNLPLSFSHAGFGILGYEPLRWSRETPVDFYSTHLCAGQIGERPGMDIGLVTDVVINYCSAVKPAFVGEWGIPSDKVNAGLRKLALRDAIWFSILDGSPGLFQGPNATHYGFEYKKAREILDPLKLDQKERMRPFVGVDVTRTAAALAATDLYGAGKADARKLVPKKAQGAAYSDLLRCCEFFLNNGVPFDFTLAPDEYEIATVPARIHELQLPESACVLSFSRGYQCKYAVFGEWETIVAYFRNVQPVVSDKFHLRAKTPRPLQVAWQLPKRPPGTKGDPWHYRLTIYDLDTDEARQSQSRVARESSVDFGNKVTGDFVFVFQR